MRARNKTTIGALGAAIGLAMTVTMAVAPASARPAAEPATVTASYSCASFEGVSVTAPSVSYSGVALRTGETLTVSVSPATTGDRILVVAGTGFSFDAYDGPATQPYAFRSGYDGVYGLGWSYILPDNSTSTATRTWTFDCSSTTVAAPAPPTQPAPTPTTSPTPPKQHGKKR